MMAVTHKDGGSIPGRQHTRTKRIKVFLRIAGFILTAMGLLMLIMCAALMYKDSTLDKKYDRAEDISYVIDASDPYGFDRVAIYRYDGIERSCKMPFYYRLFISKSQITDIYVDPDSPDRAYIKAGASAYIPRGILSLVLLLAGIVMTEVGADTKKRLVDRGRGVRIYASVVSVENAGVSTDGMNTYCITAVWEDSDGIRHSCESELLGFDPSGYIEVGEPIGVYVDPKDYKKYYMCARELQSGEKHAAEEARGSFVQGARSSPAGQKRAALRAVGLPIMLSGLIMLSICAALVYNNIRLAGYERFMAQVVGIHGVTDIDGYHPRRMCVEYNDGISTIGGAMLPKYCNLFMRTGQIIEIYVDPDEPSMAYVEIAAAICALPGIAGAVLASFGIGMLIKACSDPRKRLVDKGRGEMVYASVVSVGYTKPSAKGLGTYHIIASWDDMSGIRHSYRSEELYFDPSRYIEAGGLIRVYVDPKNYKKYYVCAQELQSGRI